MNNKKFVGKLLGYFVWLGCESNNPFQPSADDKNTWSDTSKCRHEFMAYKGEKNAKFRETG
jgi:hypothetical protein